MRNIFSKKAPCLLLPLVLFSFNNLFAAGVWDGGGGNALWSTAENWDDDNPPAEGAAVEFGTGFTSGSAINLNGNRVVGSLTFQHGATSLSINNNTLTINGNIVRSLTTGNSDIFSAVNLSGDITVDNESSGRLRFGGNLSGSGGMDYTASGAAASLQLDGDNSGWSGGLILRAGAGSTVVNVSGEHSLGTGAIEWKDGTSGPSLALNGLNHTVVNDIHLEGSADRRINPFNVSGGSGGKTVFSGDLTGDGASTLRFVPRATNISGHVTEINGSNTNANTDSRLIFIGSTHDTTGAVGNSYVIGNDQALDWGHVVLGQGGSISEEIVFLYKDGVGMAKMIEINDGDPAPVTLGTYGIGAVSTQSGEIRLTNFNVSARTNLLNLFADTDSRFTVSGNITIPGAGDVLNVEKEGAGVVELTRPGGTEINGTTTVRLGTLLVNNSTGSGLGSSDVVVEGGTLGGSGSFTGSLTVQSGGRLAPGTGIESLVSGTLSLDAGAIFGYEMDALAAPLLGADLQVVNGDLSLTSGAILDLGNLSAGNFAEGTAFTLINYTGAWNEGLFTYHDVVLENLDQFEFNGQQWRIVYDALTGGQNFADQYLEGSRFVKMTVIPEPSAAILLGGALGIGAMAGWRLRIG